MWQEEGLWWQGDPAAVHVPKVFVGLTFSFTQTRLANQKTELPESGVSGLDQRSNMPSAHR